MIILFRNDKNYQEEISAAEQHIKVAHLRTECKNDLVIGRFSVLPYYMELQNDLHNLGCTLINSFEEHSYVANFDYYQDVQEYTFLTWNFEEFYKHPEEGKFVVKGRTNSKKFQWNKMMFANSRKEAIEIGCSLLNDDFISQQGIIIRKYCPLETFETGINGLRFTNEWRLFFFKNELIDYGYYWEIAYNIKNKEELPPEAIMFAKKIASILSNKINFFSIDIARKEDGDWVLVEANDGQQSGLSCIEPSSFYNNLKLAIVKTL